MSPIQTEVADESCVSQTIVETIAEAEGIDPLELTPPLYDVIDPDALADLFTDGRTIGRIIFNYNSFEVSVFSDGYVSIDTNGK